MEKYTAIQSRSSVTHILSPVHTAEADVTQLDSLLFRVSVGGVYWALTNT